MILKIGGLNGGSHHSSGHFLLPIPGGSSGSSLKPDDLYYHIPVSSAPQMVRITKVLSSCLPPNPSKRVRYAPLIGSDTYAKHAILHARLLVRCNECRYKILPAKNHNFYYSSPLPSPVVSCSVLDVLFDYPPAKVICDEEKGST